MEDIISLINEIKNRDRQILIKVTNELKYIRERVESQDLEITKLRSLVENSKPAPKKIPKKVLEPKLECSHVTKKGIKCTRRCLQGEKYCTLHFKTKKHSIDKQKK